MSSNIVTFGGFKQSLDFNTDKRWFRSGIIPLGNTAAGAFRCVANITFLVVNMIRVPCSAALGLKQWAYSEEATYFNVTKDSTKALGLNVLAAAGSLVEAAPIVGNIPYWVSEFAIHHVQY